jgi:nicotinate-nucleotide adenylyltransferase
MKHLGIFGGTFNPIHFGHLRVAVDVLEKFELDTIIFIPSAQPPHKSYSNIANAFDRLKMTQLAIHSYPLFECSNIETKRQGVSYTIETIQEMRILHPGNVQFYYLIGIDAFFAIHTWKSFEKLFDIIPFIVMSRPEISNHSMLANNTNLIDYIQQTISREYQHSEQNKRMIHPSKQPVYYCQVTALDISSSKIRTYLKKGQSIQYLLPDYVHKYIIENKIYQTRTSYDQKRS